MESYAIQLENFKCGYTLWLTNDQFYWNPPQESNAGYAAFSVHHGAKKSGSMNWGDRIGQRTVKGREKGLHLHGEYKIEWEDYSDFDINPRPGLFKYALTRIERPGS